MIYSLVDRKADSGKSYVYRIYTTAAHVHGCAPVPVYLCMCVYTRRARAHYKAVRASECTHMSTRGKVPSSDNVGAIRGIALVPIRIVAFAPRLSIYTLCAYVNRLFTPVYYVKTERAEPMRFRF